MKTKATKLLLNAMLLILVVSIIRLITGANDLTSVGTSSAALLKVGCLSACFFA